MRRGSARESQKEKNESDLSKKDESGGRLPAALLLAKQLGELFKLIKPFPVFLVIEKFA